MSIDVCEQAFRLRMDLREVRPVRRLGVVRVTLSGLGSGQDVRGGSPSSFMTICRSDQALPFSSGLRNRYAGWNVGISGMTGPTVGVPDG